MPCGSRRRPTAVGQPRWACAHTTAKPCGVFFSREFSEMHGLSRDAKGSQYAAKSSLRDAESAGLPTLRPPRWWSSTAVARHLHLLYTYAESLASAGVAGKPVPDERGLAR
jgi:hypothetical protein